MKHLEESGRQSADLLSPTASALTEECDAVVNADRLRQLLDRGFLLSQAIERWQSRAIHVLGRRDAEYPSRISERLGDAAPPILYCCGGPALLESGRLAVVGSRNVEDAALEFTTEIGRFAARQGRTIISGGAKGVDQASMRGAIEVGGRVIGVLADSLERTSTNREHRDLLLGGRLRLISPYDPHAGFNVGNAMQRNKLIYALADAALVVSSDFGKGGTWAGATEQLGKLKFVPVYVRSHRESSPGLDALLAKGAHPWPDPHDTDTFTAVLGARPSPHPAQASEQLPLFP